MGGLLKLLESAGIFRKENTEVKDMKLYESRAQGSGRLPGRYIAGHWQVRCHVIIADSS